MTRWCVQKDDCPYHPSKASTPPRVGPSASFLAVPGKVKSWQRSMPRGHLLGIALSGDPQTPRNPVALPVSSNFPDLIVRQSQSRGEKDICKGRIFRGPRQARASWLPFVNPPSALHTIHTFDHDLYGQSRLLQVGYCAHSGSSLNPDQVGYWLTPPEWETLHVPAASPARADRKELYLHAGLIRNAVCTGEFCWIL